MEVDMVEVAGGIVLFLLGCVALFWTVIAVMHVSRAIYDVIAAMRVCKAIYDDPGPLLVVGSFIAFASTIYVTKIA